MLVDTADKNDWKIDFFNQLVLSGFYLMFLN